MSGLFKRVVYTNIPITWYSTANPFFDVQYNVALAGYTPIAFDWLISGSGGTQIYAYNHYITSNVAVLGIRMSSNPATVDQNTISLTVLYVKNGFVT